MVKYRPSGAHKSYPAPNGEWSYGPRRDATKCDVLPEERWSDVEQALRDAIKAGVVDKTFRNGFPARAWAWVNGVLHEARLSNEAVGEYHGYPLDHPEHHPSDPHGLLAKAPKVTL